ncbi:hypothetical protein AVEN_262257-1 [Araneus ventricosus]|uniref:Uncharacterized protein n=1 Tax=Araneus ventricosus TaxID=182803 RepID=A0A4Y2NJM5_ARAVE|nr:hypothetical protein AVEN_262257-1 [Araneus ventricosus]
MDLVISNRGQMTRMIPPSPNIRNTSAGDILTHDIIFSLHEVHMLGGSSTESGFEPGTLRFRHRELTTVSLRRFAEYDSGTVVVSIT